MTEESIPTISDQERTGIAKVMDVLLPGTDTLPAATEVAALDELLDRVLAADPTLAPVVAKAGRWAVDRTACLSMLREAMGDDLERLAFALHAAYYMSGDVRDRLGYPGQQRLPISLATPEQLCSDELLEPVIARGPVFVSPPKE